MASQDTDILAKPFRPWRLVTAVSVILVLISASAQWYGSQVTLPRFCEDTEDVLVKLEHLLADHPSEMEDRKPYILAARLLYLLPRQSDEAIEPYLSRVRMHLSQQCR